jgi:hypothetical protein
MRTPLKSLNNGSSPFCADDRNAAADIATKEDSTHNNTMIRLGQSLRETQNI